MHVVTLIQYGFFSASGLSETYQMLCQTVQPSMLSLNKMLPSFTFKASKILSSRMSFDPKQTQKIRVNQCALGTHLITQCLLQNIQPFQILSQSSSSPVAWRKRSLSHLWEEYDLVIQLQPKQSNTCQQPPIISQMHLQCSPEEREQLNMVFFLSGLSDQFPPETHAYGISEVLQPFVPEL